ncbi:helix-turn-helix domain-containing protein [Phaeobacter sp. JH204B]
MSIRVMSAVFESETLGATERLIMLALADHADDEGRCYPSIARLCQRTGLGERAVQTNIRKLQLQGYVEIIPGAGRNGSNLYFVRPTPAPDAPPHEMHPAPDAPPPRMKCTSTPAPDAPKPSITIIEPSLPLVAPQPEKPKKPKTYRLPEEWVPDDEYREFARELNLTDADIEEIADDFRTYWTELNTVKSRKTKRGWFQAWRNRCRDVAPKFIRNRRMAGQAYPGRHGQGGGLAGAVARRQFGGQI